MDLLEQVARKGAAAAGDASGKRASERIVFRRAQHHLGRVNDGMNESALTPLKFSVQYPYERVPNIGRCGAGMILWPRNRSNNNAVDAGPDARRRGRPKAVAVASAGARAPAWVLGDAWGPEPTRVDPPATSLDVAVPPECRCRTLHRLAYRDFIRTTGVRLRGLQHRNNVKKPV